MSGSTMTMMIHATSRPEEGKFAVPVSNNGCVVKTVRYIGRAAHAGGMPHRGINALYAAEILEAIAESARNRQWVTLDQ